MMGIPSARMEYAAMFLARAMSLVYLFFFFFLVSSVLAVPRYYMHMYVEVKG